MCTPESFVEHAERLTDIFGHWPSFHDAEVLEIHLWRGDVDPDRDRRDFPVLTAKLHLWNMVQDKEAEGGLRSLHHTLATLRFYSVDEDLVLCGFNHQNVIFSLTIEQRERDNGPSPFLAVVFHPCFGVSAEFTCLRAEVFEALPCDERGEPTCP